MFTKQIIVASVGLASIAMAQPITSESMMPSESTMPSESMMASDMVSESGTAEPECADENTEYLCTTNAMSWVKDRQGNHFMDSKVKEDWTLKIRKMGEAAFEIKKGTGEHIACVITKFRSEEGTIRAVCADGENSTTHQVEMDDACNPMEIMIATTDPDGENEFIGEEAPSASFSTCTLIMPEEVSSMPPAASESEMVSEPAEVPEEIPSEMPAVSEEAPAESEEASAPAESAEASADESVPAEAGESAPAEAEDSEPAEAEDSEAAEAEESAPVEAEESEPAEAEESAPVESGELSEKAEASAPAVVEGVIGAAQDAVDAAQEAIENLEV
ncbi:hypothetical protein, variant [Sphaeroforma arctica JP610]|uniref:Uncharacterized protein n=1 Tax=Sphaeroforma arctica JP610 TaxID=667725 RepID=A0A0L0G202_9EUKA|nr:hypothetical protein, variant [Sphaeroforma arctica JP610]KNC82223.1 hypothetical protein, variant [Sphaeroforma arctica JP610]|eukprot:XP_014156126.1 hypothetical protein, variant [Sphaeroforma arctica JP610]